MHYGRPSACCRPPRICHTPPQLPMEDESDCFPVRILTARSAPTLWPSTACSAAGLLIRSRSKTPMGGQSRCPSISACSLSRARPRITLIPRRPGCIVQCGTPASPDVGVSRAHHYTNCVAGT